MTKIKGRDVSLAMEIDGGGMETIAYARDCSIDVQCDIAEFTSPLSGRGKRNRPGRYSWTVRVETLIADSEQPVVLLERLKDGLLVTLTMDAQLRKNAQWQTLRGEAVVRGWGENAPLQGLATFNASFVGDGELGIVSKRNPTPTPRP